MNHLVTGGCGFIGTHIVERLIREGHDIHVIDNFNDYYPPKIKRSNWNFLVSLVNHLGFGNKIELIEDGILSINKKELIESPIDYIVHLAAQPGVRESFDDPELYYKQNVCGTEEVLKFANKMEVKKMVNFSSSSIYGNAERYPVLESDSTNPISPYAKSKKEAEKICKKYAQNYDLKVITFRPFTVYGPRQRPKMAISNFFQNISECKPIRIFGNGEKTRDFTYVSDIVDAVLAALNRDIQNSYEVFNIGNSNPISVNEIVNKISEITRMEPEIIYEDDAKGDVDTTYASIEKAKKILGYQPRISIDIGLEKYWAWMNSEDFNQTLDLPR